MTNTPKICRNIKELSGWYNQVKNTGKRIGFVPTMGNLHQGHLSLVKKAQELTDVVIVSIYVNPMQFAAHEDFDSYPRTLDDDIKALSTVGADAVFTPNNEILYPTGTASHTQVTVPTFEGKCCAISRPHFFTGVATVVMKLLNLVKPDVACFGEKDFQQLALIKQMVRDMCMSVEIVGVPTVREKDGLAMSSRNQYLTTSERALAPQLYATLHACQQQIQEGQRDYARAQAMTVQALTEAGFKVDYVEICSAATLAPAEQGDKALVICAAVFLSKARLIDNVHFTL